MKEWARRGWLLRAFQLACLVFLGWQLSILVRVWWWGTHPPGPTHFMVIREEERAHLHKPPLSPHPWLSAHQIAPGLKKAVIAAEDSQFISHAGFDWEGIELALRRDIRRGRLVAGGSTITQQLAKNLFLSERRSLFRKAEEMLITVMIEQLWSKNRILEVYLNSIEWGDGVFGCETAAQHYFGHSASALSDDEAALMAAMIPNPRFYDHHRAHPKLLQKKATVLARMAQVSAPK